MVRIETEDVGQTVRAQVVKETEAAGNEGLDDALVGRPKKGLIAVVQNDVALRNHGTDKFLGIPPLDDADNQTGSLFQGIDGFDAGMGVKLIVDPYDRLRIGQEGLSFRCFEQTGMQIGPAGLKDFQGFLESLGLDKFDGQSGLLGPQAPDIGKKPHRAGELILEFKGGDTGIVDNLERVTGPDRLERAGQENQKQRHPLALSADRHNEFLYVVVRGSLKNG